jgi:hypothetical protein
MNRTAHTSGKARMRAVAASRSCGLSDDEATVAVDEHHRDDTEQQSHENRADGIPCGIAGQLVQANSQGGQNNCDQRRSVFGEHRARCRIGRLEYVVEQVTVELVRLPAQLTHRLIQRHRLEGERDGEDDVRHEIVLVPGLSMQ